MQLLLSSLPFWLVPFFLMQQWVDRLHNLVFVFILFFIFICVATVECLSTVIKYCRRLDYHVVVVARLFPLSYGSVPYAKRYVRPGLADLWNTRERFVPYQYSMFHFRRWQTEVTKALTLQTLIWSEKHSRDLNNVRVHGKLPTV